MIRPNVLFISTDQQRWDTLGASGNRLIKTPNLDALAASGVFFDCCIAQNPVCMPSRISTMSGRYCSALKITHMAVTVPEETVTLPRDLGKYGYHNALIGKLAPRDGEAVRVRGRRAGLIPREETVQFSGIVILNAVKHLRVTLRFFAPLRMTAAQD